jgi:putative ABC transport system permease protein
MAPVVAGMLGGIAASLAIGRVLGSLLFRVNGHDPLTIVLVSAVLCSVAAAACLFPAVRATRVNPITALRCE